MSEFLHCVLLDLAFKGAIGDDKSNDHGGTLDGGKFVKFANKRIVSRNFKRLQEDDVCLRTSKYCGKKQVRPELHLTFALLEAMSHLCIQLLDCLLFFFSFCLLEVSVEDFEDWAHAQARL